MQITLSEFSSLCANVSNSPVIQSTHWLDELGQKGSKLELWDRAVTEPQDLLLQNLCLNSPSWSLRLRFDLSISKKFEQSSAYGFFPLDIPFIAEWLQAANDAFRVGTNVQVG